MKHRIVPTLLATVLLLGCLSGCRSAEYLHIQEHIDPFSYKETTEATETPRLTAGSYYELRSVLISLVTDGAEHSEIFLEDYPADADSDMKRLVNYMTQVDPVGAYAIDYVNYELSPGQRERSVTFDLVYRRSAGEIAAIRSVRGNEQADKLVFAALEEFAPSVTLQISGYKQEDFEKTIREYCLYHPEKTVMCSEVSASVYPESGNVRVVEFHFTYEQTKDELRNTVSDTAVALSSAYNYMRYGQTQTDCASLALSYLSGRFQYVESEDATVYSLLCKGTANSSAFASAFAYLCRSAEIECHIVEGEKNAQPYSWIMLQLDEAWYHFDIYQTVMNESRTLELRTDADMTGFTWDTEQYPVCDGTKPLEEQPPET